MNQFLRCGVRKLLRVNRCTSVCSYIAREFRNAPHWCTSNDNLPTISGPDVTKEPSTLKATTSNLEAAFRTLRDEYDERTLETMVKQQALTEAQRSLLRKPVHHHMVRSEAFFGNKHHELAAVIGRVGFCEDEQDRRIVGIVQPFGAGKTKTALMLNHAFAVLPIRWSTSQILLDKLKDAQLILFKAINQETVNAVEVQAFSDRCLRLTELTLLSVAAVFGMCASQSWFDPQSERSRLDFGLLAISSGSEVVTEIVNWFEAHIDATIDSIQFKELRTRVLSEVRAKTGLRLVFVIDEIQQLRDKCTGYCVHKEASTGMLKAEYVNSWKGEVDRLPAPGRKRCTDLFYQLLSVMMAWLGIEGAFVMCSTVFHTWTMLEHQSSPFSRGLLQRFTDTHWLSATDCNELVRHYFNVSDQQLFALDLKQFTRPVFASSLVLQLRSNLSMLNSAPASIPNWLTTSFTTAQKSAVQLVREKVKPLLDESSDSRKRLDSLTTCILLCAEILPDSELSINDPNKNKRWYSYTELINHGVLKLGSASGDADQVSLADPLAVKGVLLCYDETAEREAVLGTMAEYLKFSRSAASHDTSHKGFVFEKVLAYLALRGLIKVPWYDANGTVAFEYLKASAERAAHIDELRANTNSPILANEASFVNELLNAQVPAKLDCVLLPSKSCGPDVLFRLKPDDDEDEPNNTVVAMQSKVVKRVVDFERFMKALKSLDPATMFNAAKEEESMVWQERRGTLQVEFMRIVFARPGFTPAVQHVVHEYNLQQARKSKPSFIHLLNLDDLRKTLGPVYDVLKQPVKFQRNLVASNEMPAYKSAWKKKKQMAKNAMTDKALVELCSSWGVEYSKKTTRAKLVRALDDHEETLADRCKQLDVELRSGADPA